jgi:hypothetical protein
VLIPTIAETWYTRWAPACRNPSSGPPNATKKPWRMGKRRTGPGSQKSGTRKAHDHLCRGRGRSSAADDRANRRASWTPPVLRVTLTRDPLSAMEGITPQGRLFMLIQERTPTPRMWCGVCRCWCAPFIPGTRLILCDGLPLHRAEIVTPCLSSPMGTRIHLERVPGDAPDPHPHKSRPRSRQFYCDAVLYAVDRLRT